MNNYTTDKAVLTANFILAPSNRYVGWVEFNNGYWFGSGYTLLKMIRNIKQNLWKCYGSKKMFKILLASKPSAVEDVPEDKMTDRFKMCSYYATTKTGKLTRGQLNTEKKEPVLPKVERVELGVPPVSNCEYICEEKDGEMIVYQLTEVKRYKLHKTPWEPQTNKGVNDDND